jgi:hypothetical protein
MDPLTPTLTVLSAMITPVVIIAACASLIISTSSRAIRVEDRLYVWYAEFATLAEESPQTEALRERRALLYEQLDQLTSRARLLQRSLTACYVSLGLFVATSATLGGVAITGALGLELERVGLLPILLSMLGAGSLFYGCVLLVVEARLALLTTHGEMDFLWREGQRYAPQDVLARREARRRRAGAWPHDPRARTHPDREREVDGGLAGP